MKKSLLSLFLVFVMLFCALPVTALSASGLENFSQDSICAWWDGTSVKWHTVSGADHYDLRVYVVQPKNNNLYDFIMSKVISFHIDSYGMPYSFYEDGVLNRDFNINHIVTRQNDTISLDVKEWLGFITDSFEYEFTLDAEKEYGVDNLASYHCELVSGKALKNGYKGLGGVVNLSGVPSNGEPNTGQWIYATVTDCNIPLSSLKYTWKYYDDTYVNNYYWVYAHDGKVVPGSDNSATLRGISRDLLGKYVRLIVTADGYDGAIYSALFYYSYHTIAVDGGTAYSYGQQGSSIKAQESDTVFLTADVKDGYTFSGWQVLSGGVTINTPSVAEDASFKMGDRDVQVKANYTKNSTISTFTVTGITEPVAGEAPDTDCTLPANCGYRPTIPNYGYVNWYTEDGDLMNPDTDTFTEGKRYSAQVTLIPTEGYEFAASGLTGTMNGKDATASIFIASPKKTIYMSRWFTCSAASADYTFSGTITSYLDNSGAVKVTLVNRSNSFIGFTKTVYGNSASFSFSDVPSGLYLLTISKANHVSKTVTVGITGNVSGTAFQINPVGDANLNGKVQSNDAMLAYKHAQGKAADQLTGYAALCADANGNGKVQSNDAMQIYKQAQGQHALW